MKLKFKQQDFQTDAVNAVCTLFDGQQRQAAIFSMEQSGGQIGLYKDMDTVNRLHISDEKVLENMRAIQRKNRLPQTADLQGRQFSVEMETGTGKTYVYTKTIYELRTCIHKRLSKVWKWEIMTIASAEEAEIS